MVKNSKLHTTVIYKRRIGFKSALSYISKKKYLYLLLLPCLVYFIIFHYIPMYGIILAFKDFSFAKGILGSEWVAFDNFIYMFGLSDFYRVFFNSLYINILKMLFFFPFPIILSLCLNEIGSKVFKKTTQTLIYLPYFISWVVIGGIMVNFLSPSWGVVNTVIKSMGMEPIFFMGNDEYFRSLVVLTEIWKGAGWDTILYLATISSINPEIYESAIIDGANRLQRIAYITIPHIKNIIIILALLRIGHIMHNGFEQIFVLQNLSNLNVSEVFETYTYKIGILTGRFSLGTTVGLFTSVIGMVLLVISDRLAKVAGEKGLF